MYTAELPQTKMRPVSFQMADILFYETKMTSVDKI